MYPQGVVSSTSRVPNITGRVAVSPVADVSTDKYSTEEVRLRNKLACLYRLVDLHEWSQNIYNHITIRLPGKDDEFLINPFGFFYSEITASSLVKVNLKGEVLDPGSSGLGINQAGYVLHSALHEGKKDAHVVLHMHVPCVVAVSSMACGLLPLSQEAMIVGEVSYHDYTGILVDAQEKKSLVEDMGSHRVMLLRNHGFVVCAETVEIAFLLAYHVILACDTQVKILAGGRSEMIIPTPEVANRTFSIASGGGGGVNRQQDGKVDKLKWGAGELEWEAAMRAMDRMGLVTGHEYRRSQ